MRKEIDSGTNLYRMGKLMITMSEFEQAGNIYITLLETIFDNDQQQRVIVYHQFGYIYNQKSELSKALLHDPKLSVTYTEIGLYSSSNLSIHYSTKDYLTALFYYGKILKIERKLFQSIIHH